MPSDETMFDPISAANCAHQPGRMIGKPESTILDPDVHVN